LKSNVLEQRFSIEVILIVKDASTWE
jgi:hypothetical protein